MSGTYPDPIFSGLTLENALPVADGGTGATTPAAALTALGAQPAGSYAALAGSGSQTFSVAAPAATGHALPASLASFVINTIALLRTNTVAWPTVFVASYSTNGDGGEGMFRYVSTDTTSSDNGGTIIVDASGHRFYRCTGGAPYSIEWFGAVGNGSTVNTAAINNCIGAAITAGTSVFIPAGTFVTAPLTTVTGNLVMYGVGQEESIISTNSATGTVLNCSGNWLELRNMQFTSSVTATSSLFVANGALDSRIEGVLFSKYYQALLGSGNTGIVRDCRFSLMVNNATGYIVNGFAGALTVSGCLWYASTNTGTVGISVVNCGVMQISDCNITEQGIGLDINPGSGQGVASVYAVNSFFDTCHTYGVQIAPSGTGNVVRCRFVGCWMCSAGTGGSLLNNTGTGTLSGVEFDNCHMMFNTGNGLLLNSGTGVQVKGGIYAGNTQSGVAVGAGISGFSIIGIMSGAYGGATGNGANGILVFTGASNDYIISLCQTAGNTGAGVSDAGTGATKYVGNNIA